MSDTKPDKSIGIRVRPEVYEELADMCERLDGIPLNNFAQKSIECAIEMINQKNNQVPKWIAVCRFSLGFEKGEKIEHE